MFLYYNGLINKHIHKSVLLVIGDFFLDFIILLRYMKAELCSLYELWSYTIPCVPTLIILAADYVVS
jgi:hypothetical protein